MAKEFGGRVTPGSGAGWAVKNDLVVEGLSVEVKYTDNKSYSLKRTDLEKAETQALLNGGREFAFLVGFGDPLSLAIQREYVVVSKEYFASLLEASHGSPE